MLVILKNELKIKFYAFFAHFKWNYIIIVMIKILIKRIEIIYKRLTFFSLIYLLRIKDILVRNSPSV